MGTTATGITRYLRALYELDQLSDGDALYGEILITPETLTLEIGGVANESPTVTDPKISAYVRGAGHKRRRGITARYVNITRLVGTGTTQVLVKRTIPILQKAVFLAAVPYVDISYQDQTDWSFDSRINEWNSWQINV